MVSFLRRFLYGGLKEEEPVASSLEAWGELGYPDCRDVASAFRLRQDFLL